MSKEIKIERQVSDDIAEYFDAYHAAIQLRDEALQLPFGYKKAYRAAKDAAKNQKKFWQKIQKIYPEVALSSFRYIRLEQKLIQTNSEPSN